MTQGSLPQNVKAGLRCKEECGGGGRERLFHAYFPVVMRYRDSEILLALGGE